MDWNKKGEDYFQQCTDIGNRRNGNKSENILTLEDMTLQDIKTRYVSEIKLINDIN